MSELKIECEHCSPSHTLYSSVAPEGQEDRWARAWKAKSLKFGPVGCGTCGCRYTVEDDGVPVEQGGSVVPKDISYPKITSVPISGGPRMGGNAVYIEGSALDVGVLTVEFGGKVVQQVTNREKTKARVVVPVGQYTLNVIEELAGTFIVGEQVHGNSSGALGVVMSLAPLVIERPNRAFLPDEEVSGDASGARVKLGNPAYSGSVDVSVENDYGRRVEGAVLVGGYTYE